MAATGVASSFVVAWSYDPGIYSVVIMRLPVPGGPAVPTLERARLAAEKALPAEVFARCRVFTDAEWRACVKQRGLP